MPLAAIIAMLEDTRPQEAPLNVPCVRRDPSPRGTGGNLLQHVQRVQWEPTASRANHALRVQTERTQTTQEAGPVPLVNLAAMETQRRALHALKVRICCRFAGHCMREYLMVYPCRSQLYMKGIPSLYSIGLLLYCSQMHVTAVRPDDKGYSRECNSGTILTDTWSHWSGSSPI